MWLAIYQKSGATINTLINKFGDFNRIHDMGQCLQTAVQNHIIHDVATQLIIKLLNAVAPLVSVINGSYVSVLHFRN